MVDAVWIPTEEEMKTTRLFQWMEKLGFTDYDSFHKQTITDISQFWSQAEQELGIQWFTPYQSALSLRDGAPFPHWFEGGTLNVCYNAVDRWALRADTTHLTALQWEDENGSIRTYTFAELLDEVQRVANGLTELGVQERDVVMLYMPMIPETVISMLALSRIGAIYCPAFSGYKKEALIPRLQSSKARFIITVDASRRRGKIVPMKPTTDEACAYSPTVEKTIVVTHTHTPVQWNKDRDIDWNTLRNYESDYKCVECTSDHPFMLIYTSGTTGNPKGTVHTHAGFPIKAAFDAGICMDVCQHDTFFWYTDMGWMMGPFLVYGGLLNGASILLYEGTPDYPRRDQLWSLAARHRVTHLGLSPTLIRSMMQYGEEWTEAYCFDHLKAIGSTGEPWNREPWMWLFQQIGKSRTPIVNYSGGTEISGGILGNVLIKPISPVTFNAALPGMDVSILNEDGASIEGVVGELVLQKPWVGMTNSFYKDDKRYLDTYWSRFEDTWVHGDWAIVDEEGYYTITGRSDDTLSVAGKRIGPAEIESIFMKLDYVKEAAVIGVPHAVKGETPVLFLVLATGYSHNDEWTKELYEYAELSLGKAISPSTIHFVQDLPKTRNAKVMRRMVKAAYLNDVPEDLSALENPETLREIQQFTS
ncbi:AMP-dependent synthetase [Pontibacillus halophilus JSM 076056 = DSM 19796]|uniref:acetate--CoA ligase n=1 Tax=Pontibacillus halophilus JSM 076056 = DSM 19796 TaxID=1385510 RepID=A0A0A5GJ72_9BACI|nr:AMP-binding protein [Pontibacillus halophilus]KGX92019.1 AMP-dependent synthetase [Pontibacillus halophilus JSM 076056 = DSM 19796]